MVVESGSSQSGICRDRARPRFCGGTEINGDDGGETLCRLPVEEKVDGADLGG